MFWCSCEVATAPKHEIEEGKTSFFGSGYPGLGSTTFSHLPETPSLLEQYRPAGIRDGRKPLPRRLVLGAIRRFLQFISVASRADKGLALAAHFPISISACLKGVATANAAANIAGILTDFHRGLHRAQSKYDHWKRGRQTLFCRGTSQRSSRSAVYALGCGAGAEIVAGS